MEEALDEEREFYRVEKYRDFVSSQRSQPPPNRVGRILRRIFLLLDSAEGFLSSLVGVIIMFGGLFAVLIGAFYGPLVFLASTGGALGLTALYMNRKVGKSLQFGDSSLRLKIMGQLLGSVLVIAFMIFLLVGLPRLFG